MKNHRHIHKMALLALVSFFFALSSFTTSFAIAWFVDSDMCVNDFLISNKLESDYVAVYGQNGVGSALVLGRANEIPAVQDGLTLIESWRGIEDGSLLPTGSVRKLWPWYPYNKSITTIYCAETAIENSIFPTTMQDFFFAFNKVESIDLNGIELKEGTSLNEAFCDCASLTTLDLSHWKSKKAPNMDAMFSGCHSIESIDISNICTDKNGGSCNNLIRSCTSLKELKISSCLRLDPGNSNASFPTPSAKRPSGVYLNGGGYWYLSGHDEAMTTDEAKSFQNSQLGSQDVNIWTTDKSCWYDTDSYAGVYGTPKDCVLLFGRGSKILDSYLGNPLLLEIREIEASLARYSYSGIRLGWMEYASNIKKVVFNASVTPNTTECWFMGFLTCTEFSDLDLLDTSRSDSFKYLFNNCKSVSSLSGLNSWKTSSVNDMSNVFQGCTLLEKIDISMWDLEKTTTLANMFKNCSNVKTIDLSNWVVPKNVSYSGIFNGMQSLETAIIPTTFKFKGKSGDSWTTLPTPNARSHENWDGFWYINGYGHPYSSLDIAKLHYETTDTYVYTWISHAKDLAYAAIYSSGSNKTLLFGRGEISPTTPYGELESTYRGLETQSRDFSNTLCPWTTYKTSLTSVMSDPTCCGEDESTTRRISIPSLKNAFSNFAKLENVDIQGLDLAKCVSMEEAFSVCTSLTSINFESSNTGSNTQSLTNMERAFSGTTALKEIRGLNSLNVSGVTSFVGTFLGTAIDFLNLSSWNTSSAQNMSEMFREFTGDLVLPPNFIQGSVTNTSMMFYYSNIELLDTRAWDTSSITTTWKMFEHTPNLTEVIGISNWNTSSLQDATDTFFMCPELIADCTGWDISNVDAHDRFNFGSPHVLSPWDETGDSTTNKPEESGVLNTAITSDTPEENDALNASVASDTPEESDAQNTVISNAPTSIKNSTDDVTTNHNYNPDQVEPETDNN